MIRVEHLCKNYGDSVRALFDVNFTFGDGKAYAIIGSSGGRKSALICRLNMLEVPISGDIFYNETEINDPKTNLARVREKIGMVFQNFNLFGNMKAIDSVTYALRRMKRMSAGETRAKGLLLLEKVGLRYRVGTYPHQLSDDEKQRCAIARTLMMEPNVLLFDEPTSVLDPEMTGKVLRVLQDLNHTGVTVIVVAHEMNLAKKVVDYVVYMDKGNIEEYSKTAESLEELKTAGAKEFLSKMI